MAKAAAKRSGHRVGTSSGGGDAVDDGAALRACTAFIITHPAHQLSRKLYFAAPPSYADLVGRVHLLLAPSRLQPSQIGFSYFDAQRQRHVVDGQAGLLELYDGVAHDEEIRLRVVVKEGGAALGLREIDELLRKMFSRSDLTDGPVPTSALVPLSPTVTVGSVSLSRRASTTNSSFFLTPGSSCAPLPPSKTSPTQTAPPGLPPLGPQLGLSKDIRLPLLPLPAVLSSPHLNADAQRPVSVSSTSPENQRPRPDHLPPKPVASNTGTPSTVATPSQADDGDWRRAESVVKSIRRLVEDFPAPRPSKPKAGGQPAGSAALSSPDGVVDGLRRLVGDLRASMRRMEQIRARTVDLVGEAALYDRNSPSPSPNPSPSASPPARALSVGLPPGLTQGPPHLYHPIPEHPIPRPTFHEPPSMFHPAQPLVTTFAPDLSTPPRIASPGHDADIAGRNERGSWAFLPTALDLDLEGAGVGKLSLGSPLPSFVLSPRRALDDVQIDTLYPATAPSAGSESEKPSLADFPPLSAVTGRGGEKGGGRSDNRANTEQRNQGKDDADYHAGVDDRSFNASTTASSVSESLTKDSTAASSAHPSASSSGPTKSINGPPTSTPAAATSPTTSRRHTTAQATHARAVQSQLLASSSPSFSQQHQYQPAHQQDHPYGLPNQYPQQQAYGMPQGWMQLPTATANATSYVCVPCVPGTMMPNGQALGWSAGHGMGMVMVNGQGGSVVGNGYGETAVFPGYNVQQQQMMMSGAAAWQQAAMAMGRPLFNGTSRPLQPPPPGLHASSSPSSVHGRPPTLQHHSSSSGLSDSLSSLPAAAAPCVFPPFAHAQPFKPSSSTATANLSAANIPHYSLPPPPRPGQTSPPPMPAHLLPAYLRLYGPACFPDAAVRIQRADEALSRIRRAGGVGVDEGGWIQGARGGES